MDEKLKNQIDKLEKRHRSQLLLHKLSIFLSTFATRGFHPFEEGIIHAAITLATRLFLIVVLYGMTGNFLLVILCYAAIHAVAYFAGIALYASTQSKLALLAADCQTLLSQYLRFQEDRHGIRGGWMHFDDGVSVGSGAVQATMRRDYGQMDIFMAGDPEDYAPFYERQYQPQSDDLIMEKNIASVAFNKKFHVITKNQQRIPCMTYLSPSMQLQMTNAAVMKEFYSIRIRPDTLQAKTHSQVDPPRCLDIFSLKPLAKYFADIDRYCRQLRTMAQAVHAQFREIDFMRGSAI